MSKRRKSPAVSVELIERRIYLIRGQKVMLDSDLAALYGVITARLNQQVRRNLSRFPDDFMFQLSDQELANLMLQNATSSWGGRRTPPLAFTELGVAMLSSVLNSERAVQMNILIVRAFVRLRDLLASNKELAMRIEKLEAGQKEHKSIIAILAEEIDGLQRLPEPKRRPIGFTANLDE